MHRSTARACLTTVAPVRERGLKFQYNEYHREHQCRSCKGAWIEIPSLMMIVSLPLCRSREGAWIEIRNMVGFSVLLTQITHSD